MPRIRITIEYDLDPDQDIAREINDWKLGHVEVDDIITLRRELNAVVEFAEITPLSITPLSVYTWARPPT